MALLWDHSLGPWASEAGSRREPSPPHQANTVHCPIWRGEHGARAVGVTPLAGRPLQWVCTCATTLHMQEAPHKPFPETAWSSGAGPGEENWASQLICLRQWVPSWMLVTCGGSQLPRRPTLASVEPSPSPSPSPSVHPPRAGLLQLQWPWVSTLLAVLRVPRSHSDACSHPRGLPWHRVAVTAHQQQSLGGHRPWPDPKCCCPGSS